MAHRGVSGDGAWVPRRGFPPVCPGTGEECKREKCRAARKYSWLNVFLSIPFDPPYRRTAGLLKRTLRGLRLVPVTAERKHYGSTVAENIAGCVCSSAHAVIELSHPTASATARGVVAENGFIRAMIPTERLLFVARRKADIPAELAGYTRDPYGKDQELESTVHGWAKEQIVEPLDAVKRILFSSGACQRYGTWLHCVSAQHEGHTEVADAPPKVALSGGGSGHALIKAAFNTLRSIDRVKKHRVLERKRNTDDEDAKSTGFGEKRFAVEVENKAKKRNLFLLDAPIAKGPKWEHGLNWMANGVLQGLRCRRGNSLTVGFRLLDNGGGEEKQIVYLSGSQMTQLVATKQKDYGAIIRAPNPYRSGAFVLILAGIHAPASHAAAEIVVTPSLAEELLEFVYKGGGRPSHLFFAALFGVRRTYFPGDLGSPEWIHSEEL